MSGPGDEGDGGARIVGPEDLGAAEAELGRGGLVALPTDTVYGLAARLDRPGALEAVFAAKDRPAGLALPVLVGSVDQVEAVAGAWPPQAAALAHRLWPGALTLVVPVAARWRGRLGGDGTTVGLRLPDAAVVRALCARGGPLAVTSANRHGEAPCVTAAQCAGAFAPEVVAVVVDGGRCDGLPSTVADCTVSPPRRLRAGGVEWSEVLATLTEGP